MKQKIYTRTRGMLNDVEPISITLIGAGATGSRLAVKLMDMDQVLLQLGYKGIKMNIYDFDYVENHNLGKQKFFKEDITENKAVRLAYNLSFTHDRLVQGFPKKLTTFDITKTLHYTKKFLILCVDSVKARNEILTNDKIIHAFDFIIDIGNAEKTGQWKYVKVKKKRMIAKHLKTLSEEPDIPSCSMAESIAKQSLMINDLLTSFLTQSLFDFFLSGKLTQTELYLNLNNYQISTNSKWITTEPYATK